MTHKLASPCAPAGSQAGPSTAAAAARSPEQAIALQAAAFISSVTTLVQQQPAQPSQEASQAQQSQQLQPIYTSQVSLNPSIALNARCASRPHDASPLHSAALRLLLHSLGTSRGASLTPTCPTTLTPQPHTPTPSRRLLDEAQKRRLSLTASQAVSNLRRISLGGGPDKRGQKRKLLPAGNPVSSSIEAAPPTMLLGGFQRPKVRKT